MFRNCAASFFFFLLLSVKALCNLDYTALFKGHAYPVTLVNIYSWVPNPADGKPSLGKKPLLSTNISPTGWLVSKGVHFIFSLPQLHTCIIMIDNIDSHTCTCKICTFFSFIWTHTTHAHTTHACTYHTMHFFSGWVGGILTTFSQGGKLRMTAPVMRTRSYSRPLRHVWRQDICFPSLVPSRWKTSRLPVHTLHHTEHNHSWFY